MRPIYDLASVFAAQINVAETEAGRVYEPVIALVTDNKDPSKLGRVKLKIPVLTDKDKADKDQDASWWAPVVMLGAGKNRGWFFIPEVKDEVLVLFEHGDINRPLVIGGLWNGKDKPPEKNPGGNPRRVIKSRAGSKIIFDDENKLLIIEDGGGKGRITMDAGNNKITIEALVGDVALQAPAGNIQFVAKQAEFKAGQNLELHAGAAMAWGTDASATVKSTQTTLSGSKVNINCKTSKAPEPPESTPRDIKDPYGS